MALSYPPTAAELTEMLRKYPWANNLSADEIADALEHAKADLEAEVPALVTHLSELSAEIKSKAHTLCLQIGVWYASLPFLLEPRTGSITRETLDQKRYLDRQIRALKKQATIPTILIDQMPE